jgi:hypothetical protein
VYCTVRRRERARAARAGGRRRDMVEARCIQ